MASGETSKLHLMTESLHKLSLEEEAVAKKQIFSMHCSNLNTPKLGEEEVEF